MAVLKQSTAYTRAFLVVQSSDHITGLTGAAGSPDNLVVNISKAGSSFAQAGGTVTEISSGWYKIALTTTDTNTLGDLAYHITSTSGDPTDFVDQVCANILGDTLPANATQINGVSTSSVTAVNANIGQTQPVNFTGTGASALVKSDMVDIAGAAVSTTSAQIGVNAVNVGGTAQTGRDLGASVLISSGTGTGQLDVTTGVIKSNLAQILGTALTETSGQIAGAFKKLFNVAAPTLTCLGIDQTGDNYARLGAPAGASVSADVAAVKTDTAAIKLKTDNLPASPAAVGSAMTLSSGAILRATFAADTGLQTARSNTAAAGAASTITLDAAASATDNFYNGCVVYLTGGTGVGQSRTITGYVGATQVATVDRAWATNPDATSTFAIRSDDVAKLDSSLQVTAASVQGNVTGSVASVTGAVGSVTGAVGSVTGNVGGNVVGSVASVTAGVTVTTNSDKTGYALTAAYDLAKTAAQAGDAMALTAAERTAVADAALDRDMSVGADSGSPTVRTVRQALRFLRNKWAISGGTLTVYKEDDTTASWTSAITTTAGNPVSTSDPA